MLWRVMLPALLNLPCVLQVRLEAMDKVVALAQDSSAADNTAVLVQAMAHLPGWDEKNFQVGGGGAPLVTPHNRLCSRLQSDAVVGGWCSCCARVAG